MASSPSEFHQTDVRRAEQGERARRLGWLHTMIRDEGRRHRWLSVLSLVGLVLVTGMALLTMSMPTLPLDLPTTRTLQAFDHPTIHFLMEAISFPGFVPQSVVIILAVLAGIWWALGWRDALYLFAFTALQGGINLVLRMVIGRPRPSPELVNVAEQIGSTSYPSGHVMIYVVFYGFLFFLAWRRFPPSVWRSLMLAVTGLLVALVGPARMYLGAHWLSDTVAGYILGFVILAVAIEVYLKYVAPDTPTEEGGAVGAHDRALG